MAKNSGNLGRFVKVHLLQQDMEGFANALPYEQQDKPEKWLFTEDVVWGEVWIVERSPDGMWWAGYVRNGELFLDRSKRDKFLWNRKHERQVPTPLNVGHYKIWLDAWINATDYMYKGDAHFTRDGDDDDPASSWKAPPLPSRKHWQDIEVKRPAKPGDPCVLKVRSRRFHWIYRVSRLVEVLDARLGTHEALVSHVAQVRSYADWLRQFLSVLYDSGNNMAILEADPELTDTTGERKKQFEQMQMFAREVTVRCQNFIRYGASESSTPLPERAHLNNLAHLLWQLVTDVNFAREVDFFGDALAEEHRMLLSRLGHLFNRVPRTFKQVTPKDDFSVSVEGESIAYGQRFAEEVTLPYYDEKAAAAGQPLPFGMKSQKPSDLIKWVNSCRRYTVSMLNAASIFVNKTEMKWSRLRWLLTLEDVIGDVNKSDELLKLADKTIEDMENAGKWELVGKLRNNRALLLKDALAADDTLAPEVSKIDSDMQNLSEKIQAVKDRESEKILDGLKKSRPSAVYLAQSSELLIKSLVAWSAWNAYVDSAGGPPEGSTRKGIEAVLKTLDAEGSLLQQLGLQRILRATWMAAVEGGSDEASLLAQLDKRLGPLGKFGKGLSAVADIGSAVIYSYDIFVTNTYGDELLQRYLPEDATTMYGFHLVTWGGKWLVAAGSGTGVFSAAPIGAQLQAIGYLAQLVGEFGEELSSYGAAEHKLFHDVHQEMSNRALATSARLREFGCELNIHPFHDRMVEDIEKFKWMGVDPDKLKTALAAGP